MSRLTRFQDGAALLLRLATAANFLAAVSGRFGLWGGGSWTGFLAYTAEVNAFAPRPLVPVLAVAATGLELTIGVLLMAGWQTRKAAVGAAGLTLLFALAMTVSLGAKEALNYSVWVDSASALLLATMPRYRWSLDAWRERATDPASRD